MKNYWSLKLSDARFLFLLFVTLSSAAQFSKPEEPKASSNTLGPYLFPVNPGVPNSLAGTMGELRSTHFHAGIDVRTNNMAGVPIRATQRGYISRVTVSSYGYGKALFITHPDGHTSVYGHLDGYRGAIGEHVRQQHYARKSFDLDLTFEPHQFPVEQGDTVAVSGNTGGSSGAHLHFEIRDENNHALNPLQFGFTEITDKAAPIAQKVALKTVNRHSRINDRFGRFEFSLVRKGDSYSLPVPILAHGTIAIELLAFDKLDVQSPFRTGINFIEAFANGERFFVQQIDKVDFENSRAILAVMDFEVLKQKGARYNKLYIDDGNPLPYYPARQTKGFVSVVEKDVEVVVKLKDFSGHESVVNFTLKATPLVEEVPTLPVKKNAVDYDIIDNTLVVSSKAGPEPKAMIYASNQKLEVTPSYQSKTQRVYLINLQEQLPDSIQTAGGMLRFTFKSKIPSGTDYTYYSDIADITFPEGALYDTLFLNLQISDSGNLRIGNRLTPLHKPIEVVAKKISLAPDKKTALYRNDLGRLSLVPSEWTNQQVKFTTRDLGEFIFLKDTIAPSITRIHCNSLMTRFRIKDNLSGIAYFEATVDGEWLLMHYDYKTGILYSEKLDRQKPLKGDFVLRVVDAVGNEQIFKQKIL